MKIYPGSDLEGAIIKAYFKMSKEDAGTIKSFVNQFYIKRWELISKLEEGNDDKDKMGKKFRKKRRGTEVDDNVEEVDTEPKDMVKRALVVFENDMERMKNRVKYETSKNNANKTMKIKNHPKKEEKTTIQ